MSERTYSIRGAIFEVYKYLGPGLLESIYEEALCFELSERGHQVESQIKLDVYYKGNKLNREFRLDLLVDQSVILEIKSVETLHPVHYKQLLTYLKLAQLRFGLLVNFNSEDVNSNIHRIINGY